MKKEYSFGLSEYTTWPWSFERDVRLCNDLKIPFIEVTEFKLDREAYGDQFQLLEQSSLGVSSVQMTIHSLFKDSLIGEPPEPDDRMTCMRQSIERMAPHLPEGTPFVVITGIAPDGNADAAYERARQSFADLARFARRHRMRVAFEPLNPVLMHTDTSICTLQEAVQLVNEVGDEDFGLCVDFWNIWQSAYVENLIAGAGDRIFAVQTSDWRRPHANADRRNLGDGTLPLVSLINAVRKSGFTGAYVLEIFSTQSLPDSVWRSDLRAAVERGMQVFDDLWNRSTAAIAAHA